MTLRPGRDSDAPQFIDLIAGCWAEYPGCVMDVDGENPELRALATYFAGLGGMLWAVEHDGVVVGMVGVRPDAQTARGAGWELCRLYVAATQRGTGMAARLLDVAQAFAAKAGGDAIDLWSDTRFDRAHRFYERHGFVRDGAIRALDDVSHSLEFRYAKPLVGLAVRELDTAAAASAARSLGRLLQTCVADGASVSFLPPLALDVAETFYRGKAADVAAEHRVVLVAWLDGQMVGSVMVDLDMPANQRHRCEVQKLLVHPHARRRGVARCLMQHAENAALRAGRSLLVLDTNAGSQAEPLYRATGWIEAGQIPGFSRGADGELSATVVFYKDL